MISITNRPDFLPDSPDFIFPVRTVKISEILQIAEFLIYISL
jgi:hypothetical protein